MNKTNVAYIDSGGTHHFFHSRSYFETYETIDTTDVSVASGKSNLVGKGTVTLPINGSLKVEAFHAPQFESNIISVRALSKTYEIAFS